MVSGSDLCTQSLFCGPFEGVLRLTSCPFGPAHREEWRMQKSQGQATSLLLPQVQDVVLPSVCGPVGDRLALTPLGLCQVKIRLWPPNSEREDL